MEACDGDRGILIANLTGLHSVLPGTANPFYGLNPLAAYEISFKVNIFYNLGNVARIYLFADDDMDISGLGEHKLIGETPKIEVMNECIEVKILIVGEDNVADLVSHPYLNFEIQASDDVPRPNYRDEELVLDVSGVMDDIAACKLIDFDINEFNCEQLCINVTSECPFECNNEAEPENDCEMLLAWYSVNDYESEHLIEDCSFPYIGIAECCIDVDEEEEFFPLISLRYVVGGETVFSTYTPTAEHNDCQIVTVNTTQTWDNVSPFDRFELITVQSGVVLTIQSDQVIKFCEDGKLVINPGGKVILNGTLTASCEAGWEGVEVQGDGEANQYYDEGLLPQGYLECNEGSLIEHARVAVKLYGPDWEDAGGQIYAEGAHFINNRRGLDFAPYNNYFPTETDQKIYYSKVRHCTFDITDDFLYDDFLEHIRMEKVFGLGFYGNYFGFNRTLEEPVSPVQFGIGILANDSKFSVGSANDDDPGDPGDPCFPDCEYYTQSVFQGLGLGIKAGRMGRNRPFDVYNCYFTGCYFGIYSDGISGANILFNEFEMGDVVELAGDEDQVGVSLNGYTFGMDIEENRFYNTGEVTDNKMGIVVRNLGEFDNVIRKNTFIGMTVGNEAFERNAIDDPFLSQGLVYLCNQNSDVEENDFYVVNTTKYDNIRLRQAFDDFGIPRATGNVFSSTGSSESDFNNLGDLGLIYFYYNTIYQYPDEETGLVNKISTGHNPCNSIPCLHPCITSGDFEGEVTSYYENEFDFKNSMRYELYDDAAYFRRLADSNLVNITRYIECDTTDFDRDSLRAWYYRSESIAGDLLLAGDYFDANELTYMQLVLNRIPIRFALDADQLLDIERVDTIYGMLSNRTLHGLTSNDIDSLVLFADSYGASCALARSTLSLLDSFYTPRYYIPGEVNPRSNKVEAKPQKSSTINIYPNPVTASVSIDVPYDLTEDCTFRLYSVDGVKSLNLKLNKGHNEIQLINHPVILSGLYFYEIIGPNQVILSGKLVISQ